MRGAEAATSPSIGEDIPVGLWKFFEMPFFTTPAQSLRYSEREASLTISGVDFTLKFVN